MARKPFDAKLHEENDKKAREWVRKAMPPGYEVVDSEMRTAVDLQVFKDGELQFYIEPEIKKVWSGDFKYDTVHLPVRKSKYCYLNKPTLFIIFRSDGEQFFCFWDKVVRQSEPKMVPNKYVPQGELFFIIPIHEAKRSIEVALRQHWRREEERYE